MNNSELELWRKIQDFQFDNRADSFQFSQRLARENRWSQSYTLAVLEEYRRFLFLACVAEHSVTPSIDVDEAWHLHMIYSISYWNELCDKTLNRKLHHGPTKGGHAEAVKYDLQYQQTMSSYEKYFGEKPPVAIWPEPDERFRSDFQAVRVDMSRHWVVKKPTWILKAKKAINRILLTSKLKQSGRFRLRTRSLIIPLFICLVAIGCSVVFDKEGAGIEHLKNPVTRYGAEAFLTFYTILGVFLLAVTYYIYRTLLANDSISEFNPEAEKAEVIALMMEELWSVENRQSFFATYDMTPASAILSGEVNRLAFLSNSRLIAEKKITYAVQQDNLDKGQSVLTLKIVENATEPTNKIDKTMFDLIHASMGQNKALTEPALFAAFNHSAEVEKLRSELKKRELFKMPGNFLVARLIVLVFFMIFLGIGISRLQVGTQRGKPVENLIIGTSIFSVIFIMLNSKAVLRLYFTPGGQALRRIMYASKSTIDNYDEKSEKQSDRYWQRVAVVGVSALPAIELFCVLIYLFKPSNNSSCSSSSDSGGSSGGGGCGGCSSSD